MFEISAPSSLLLLLLFRLVGWVTSFKSWLKCSFGLTMLLLWLFCSYTADFLVLDCLSQLVCLFWSLLAELPFLFFFAELKLLRFASWRAWVWIKTEPLSICISCSFANFFSFLLYPEAASLDFTSLLFLETVPLASPFYSLNSCIFLLISSMTMRLILASEQLVHF